uniref:Uncharacterized protein n=1 Tax=Rhipicephalus appendiculatus TaxID=34631 RepID=A0A131YPN2_RHIAP
MAYVASRSLRSKLYFLESITRNATAPCLPALQRRAAGGKADEDDKPYTYTTSNAAKWKAAQSFRTPETNAPPAQRWSVLASISAFLIYFCVLREENDLDQHLARPITETVPELKQLGTPPPVPTEWIPPAWRD